MKNNKNPSDKSWKIVVLIFLILGILISQIRTEWPVKFGLKEAQRQEIFKEIVRAGDRANLEAESIFPTFDKYDIKWELTKNLEKKIRKADELRMQYLQELMNKYQISSEVLSEISQEAHKKNWPLD